MLDVDRITHVGARALKCQTRCYDRVAHSVSALCIIRELSGRTYFSIHSNGSELGESQIATDGGTWTGELCDSCSSALDCDSQPASAPYVGGLTAGTEELQVRSMGLVRTTAIPHNFWRCSYAEPRASCLYEPRALPCISSVSWRCGVLPSSCSCMAFSSPALRVHSPGCMAFKRYDRQARNSCGTTRQDRDSSDAEVCDA